jgi:hypothetical protein
MDRPRRIEAYVHDSGNSDPGSDAITAPGPPVAGTTVSSLPANSPAPWYAMASPSGDQTTGQPAGLAIRVLARR